MQTIRVSFPDWAPDRSDIDSSATESIVNVYPGLDAYRPIKAFASTSDALGARCQGAFSARGPSGIAANFACTGKNIYSLSDGSWTDVTNSDGDYAADAADFWEFGQFGLNVIAVNIADDPQNWLLGTSTEFADLGGSPPKARHIGIVRDFVVLGNLATGANKIQWSAFNDSTGWTIGTDQSDDQEFPDGGDVQAVVGGEVGYIVQERAIRRMSYIGGDLIFQFDKMEQDRGTRIASSVIPVGAGFFYYGIDGFYYFNGNRSEPIGFERVDNFFNDDLDEGNFFRMKGASDPARQIVFWIYPSVQSSNGDPDSLIGYAWSLNKWFYGRFDLEYAYTMITTGVSSLEDLDDISASIDDLLYSLDSPFWSNSSLLAGLFSTDHKLGAFSGGNAKATLCTDEKMLVPGKRVFVNAVRPVCDASTLTVSVGQRQRAADPVAYKPGTSLNAIGICPQRVTGRSMCFKLTVPAGEDWSWAQSVEVSLQAEGIR